MNKRELKALQSLQDDVNRLMSYRQSRADLKETRLAVQGLLHDASVASWGSRWAGAYQVASEKLVKAQEKEWEVFQGMRALSSQRRRAAETLNNYAEALALEVNKLVDDHNGEVRRDWAFHTRLDAPATARSAVKARTRQKGSQHLTTTDATHTIRFNVGDVLALKRDPILESVAELSAVEGLPVLGMRNAVPGVAKASWVKVTARKRMQEVHGYIAWVFDADGMVIYHDADQIKAEKGLARKVRRLREARENPKPEAVQLSARQRLKTDAIIRLKDVREATGWCRMGCRQWLSRWLPAYERAHQAPREDVGQAAVNASWAGCSNGKSLLKLMDRPPV